MPQFAQDPDGGAGYARQLETLRSTAKWLVAISAGVGGVLLAGLQFTNIGWLQADSWRLYAAMAAAVAGLIAVGMVVKEATSVLAHDWLTLASFTDETTSALLKARGSKADLARRETLEEQIQDSRHELFGHLAGSLEELHGRLQDACCQATQADVPAMDQAQVLMLRGAAREVVQYANYYWTLELFKRLRNRLAVAAVIILVSVVTFAYAVNAEEPPQRVQVQVVSGK